MNNIVDKFFMRNFKCLVLEINKSIIFTPRFI